MYMIIVHACTMIIVHACTMIIVHACAMIIVHACNVLHGSCSTKVGPGRGSGGRSPPAKQGGLATRPPNICPVTRFENLPGKNRLPGFAQLPGSFCPVVVRSLASGQLQVVYKTNASCFLSRNGFCFGRIVCSRMQKKFPANSVCDLLLSSQLSKMQLGGCMACGA